MDEDAADTGAPQGSSPPRSPGGDRGGENERGFVPAPEPDDWAGVDHEGAAHGSSMLPVVLDCLLASQVGQTNRLACEDKR